MKHAKRVFYEFQMKQEDLCKLEMNACVSVRRGVSNMETIKVPTCQHTCFISSRLLFANPKASLQIEHVPRDTFGTFGRCMRWACHMHTLLSVPLIILL